MTDEKDYSNSTLNTTIDSIDSKNTTNDNKIINESALTKINNIINKLDSLNTTNTTNNNNNVNINKHDNKKKANKTKKNNKSLPRSIPKPYIPRIKTKTKTKNKQVPSDKNDSHIFNGIIFGAMVVFILVISIFIYFIKKKRKNKTKKQKDDANKIVIKTPSSDKVIQKDFHALQNTSSVSDSNVVQNNSLNEIKIANNINQNLSQEINNIINSSGSSSSSGRRRREKKNANNPSHSNNTKNADQNMNIEKEIKDQIKKFVIDEHSQ